MMTQPTNNRFPGCIPDSMPAAHIFSKEAMATIFEIFIFNEDEHYAAQAAWAAFDELDGIEQKLSRFIENSDVSEINNLSRTKFTTRPRYLPLPWACGGNLRPNKRRL